MSGRGVRGAGRALAPVVCAGLASLAAIAGIAALTVVAGPAAAEPASGGVEVVLGGDVMLGRVGRRATVVIGGAEPLAGVARALERADLALVNLETALCDAPPPWAGRPLLVAPPASVAALAGAGVDAVSLANNHALDCGPGALEAGARALGAAGVLPLGLRDEGRVAVTHVTLSGWRVALIAATDRLPGGGAAPVAWGAPATMRRELPPLVRQARRGADAVVVTLHWGAEGASRPTEGQRRLARALVDAGAAIVHGHHAHVLQGVEARPGGVIVYGTGNLVSDMDGAARRSALFVVQLADGPRGLAPRRLELLPLVLGPDGAPRPAAGDEARAIVDHVAARSRELGTALVPDEAGDRAVWSREP